MDPYELIITREQRKIEILKARIKQSYARIEIIESLRSDTDLDSALGLIDGEPEPQVRPLIRRDLKQPRKVGTDSSAALSSVTGSLAFGVGHNQTRRVSRALPSRWLDLFEYIGRDGKSADELSRYLKDHEVGITEGAMRTGLMNYRKEFGLIENPKRGFYRLSDLGASTVAQQTKESLAAENSEA